MKLTKSLNVTVAFVLATILCLTASVWGQTKEQLAAKRYVDPKGYFKIVPPAGWQVQEYSQDPRGKVAFLAPDARLGIIIIVQADGISTIDELVNSSKQKNKWGQVCNANMIMSYTANLEMSYSSDAKLSDLRGGQDGRKGHNHGEAEGFKEIACNSQSN